MTFSRSEWAVNFIFGLSQAHLESNPLAAPAASPVPEPDSKLVSLVMTPWLLVCNKNVFRQFLKDLHILTGAWLSYLVVCLCPVNFCWICLTSLCPQTQVLFGFPKSNPNRGLRILTYFGCFDRCEDLRTPVYLYSYFCLYFFSGTLSTSH